MLGKKGFTIIELLTVIAIISILATIIIINTGKNPDRDVRLEADRLTAFIRSAQNRALSAEKISDATGKICGFGVYRYSDSELWIYYVETRGGVTNPNPLDVDCSAVDKKYPDDPDYKVDAFVFRNNVSLDPSSNLENLFFLSPHGEVYNTGGLPVSISLTKENTTVPDVVQVDETGRIY